MSRLTRDGTAEPVSRGQILRRVRGQGNIHLPCSADHEHDWQPYLVDPYSATVRTIHWTYIIHTYINTYHVQTAVRTEVEVVVILEVRTIFNKTRTTISGQSRFKLCGL